MKNFITIVLMIGIIVGTIFGVKYEVDTWNKKNNQYSQNETVDNKNEEQNIETDITDYNLIQNISNKIANIMSASGYNDGIYSFMKFSYGLLKNGLTDTYKQEISLDNVEDYRWTTLSHSISHIDALKQSVDNNDIIDEVSENSVNEKAVELFGSKIMNPIFKTGSCPGYYYDNTNNMYYRLSGCGGTGTMYITDYKSAFKQKADEIYVYVSYAYVQDDEGIVYKDFDNDESLYSLISFKDEVKKIEPFSKFRLNETNYQDFHSYKYTFKKSENNYYLISIQLVK